MNEVNQKCNKLMIQDTICYTHLYVDDGTVEELWKYNEWLNCWDSNVNSNVILSYEQKRNCYVETKAWVEK